MLKSKIKFEKTLENRVEMAEVPKEDYEILLKLDNFNALYNKTQALLDINMEIRKNCVTALIGPSGCGKSTLLKSINRMNDLIENFTSTGKIFYGATCITGDEVDVINLRKKIGMIFQKPNPFPMSIYDNIAYGPKLHGTNDKAELDMIVENCLIAASLWDEVKDRLDQSALGLSGGQQQRLCIARALAVKPEILLMDEPTASLDPIATAHIEGLIEKLKKNFTVVIVTHNMQQAKRISDFTAFLYLGKLVEFDSTAQIFNAPVEELTENYIAGQFG